jgi:hypothetical protein
VDGNASALDLWTQSRAVMEHGYLEMDSAVD